MKFNVLGLLLIAGLLGTTNASASDKGSVSVSSTYNWSSQTPSLKVNWSLNNSKYLWAVNNSGNRFKLCWRRTNQAGDACWFNKRFYSNAVYGATIPNLASNTNYRVKLEAYGKKKKAFPTSFFRWRVIESKKVKTVKAMSCSGKVSWWNSNSKKGNFDGANCFVYDIPSGLKPFIWNNNYYVGKNSPGHCAVGKWDTANCWIGKPPAGTTAFLYQGNFYYSE